MVVELICSLAFVFDFVGSLVNAERWYRHVLPEPLLVLALGGVCGCGRYLLSKEGGVDLLSILPVIRHLSPLLLPPNRPILPPHICRLTHKDLASNGNLGFVQLIRLVKVPCDILYHAHAMRYTHSSRQGLPLHAIASACHALHHASQSGPSGAPAPTSHQFPHRF